MTIPAACPNRQSLAAMLDGSLASTEQMAVEEHVGACPACQERLEALIAGAEAAELPLRELGEESKLVANRVAAESASAMSRQPPPQPNFPLTFLEPSLDPSSLGRLGQYEVLELLGRGGMGIVFKGRDTRLCRIVAIKVLTPELAANPTAHKRFLREAQAAAAVSHDHVITIFAVEPGPVPFLVMEFIDGRSLQQKIDAEGYLQLDEILRIGHQIAAGLAAAHAQGLTHRDIKPTNILLQNGIQRVQITDFGLARAVDDVSMTYPGEVPGTPQFMSPEQAQGRPVDHRSDLFSLGSVLYAMCTGRSPFRAESAVASLRLVCDVQPRAIRAINPSIPAWLPPIIDRLLAKDPDQRYQTAGEVAALLSQHLAHLQNPAAVLPAATAEVPSAAVRANGHTRHRRGWMIGALGLVTVLSVLGVTEATSVTDLTSTVIRVVSGEGALIVELDDPTIKVTVDGEEVVITEAGAREVRVRPGPHKVAATKNGKPAAVSEELVTISRGGRRVVRVTYEPSEGQQPVGEQPRVQQPLGQAPSVAPAIPAVGKVRPPSAPPPAAVPFDADEAAAHQQAWADYLGVPVEFTNTLGMKLRLIPPGEFVMGGTPAEVAEALEVGEDPFYRDTVHSEAPQHDVQLSEPWFLGVHEVTQEEYEAVSGENPSYFSPHRGGQYEVTDLDTRSFPVEQVSWNQSARFCNALSREEGLTEKYAWQGEACTVRPGSGYHLPTEAQWEFACRAGTVTRYWFAATGEQLSSYGWHKANAAGRTHTVGQLRPNPFGLHDLYGNVSEWCQDGWQLAYYAGFEQQTAVDPTGPSSDFFFRVLRGGSFRYQLLANRSAKRSAGGPNLRLDYVGLRVALSVDGVKSLLPGQQEKPPGLPRGEPP